jgi:hypothetical protein
MDTSDLEIRFGKTRVTAMLSSLKQIEATNPACFEALITRAVLSLKDSYPLPFHKDMLREPVKRHIPTLDDETAELIGEEISRWILTYITAEALL